MNAYPPPLLAKFLRNPTRFPIFNCLSRHQKDVREGGHMGKKKCIPQIAKMRLLHTHTHTQCLCVYLYRDKIKKKTNKS